LFAIGFVWEEVVDMLMNLQHVLVQMHFKSKRAKKYYSYADQRRPLGDIDISQCQSVDDLEMVWRETVNRDGRFTLVAKDNRGRLFRSIGSFTVRHGKIHIKDRRCTLSTLFRKTRERADREEEEDFEFTGG
jgi:hypothetical protein